MIQSRWLDERDQELKVYRETVKKKTKVLAIAMTVLCVGLVILSILKAPVENVGIIVGVIGVIYGVVMLIILMGTKVSKNNKSTMIRGRLEPYLRTQEDVEAFEKEMYGESNVEVPMKTLNGGGIKFTDSWIVQWDNMMGKRYNLVKISDIDHVHGIKMGSGEYGFDLHDIHNHVLALHPLTKKEYFQLMDALELYAPHAEWRAYVKGRPTQKGA